MNKFKSCWRKQSQLLWNQQGWVYTLVGQEKTTQNNKSETIRYGKWTELIERFSCTVTLSKSLSRTTRWLLPLKTLQAHLGVIYGTVSSGFNSPNPSVIWQPALQTNVIIPYGTKLNTHFINHVTDYTRLCFVVRITTWGKRLSVCRNVHFYLLLLRLSAYFISQPTVCRLSLQGHLLLSRECVRASGAAQSSVYKAKKHTSCFPAGGPTITWYALERAAGSGRVGISMKTRRAIGLLGKRESACSDASFEHQRLQRVRVSGSEARPPNRLRTPQSCSLFSSP